MAFLMRFVRSLRTGAGLTALAVATVVISGAVLLLSSTSSGETGAIAVHLEGRDEAGPDAFMAPLGEGDEQWNGFELPPPTTGPLPQVVGTQPGLYGGTGIDDLCNKNVLISFLKNEPPKAAAWVRAQDIESDEIATFVHSLTPAKLLTDTLVLNHGYQDGKALPRNSVLQAGTAVLLDAQGVPRVRCKCGNPLKATDITAARPKVEFIGEPWEAFDGDEVRRTVPGRQIDQFELVDLGSSEGTRFRPTGSDGIHDVIVRDDREQSMPTPEIQVPELPLPNLRLSDLREPDPRVSDPLVPELPLRDLRMDDLRVGPPVSNQAPTHQAATIGTLTNQASIQQDVMEAWTSGEALTYQEQTSQAPTNQAATIGTLTNQAATSQELVEALTSGEALTYQEQTSQAPTNQAATIGTPTNQAATPQELVEALTSGEALTYQEQTSQAPTNQAATIGTPTNQAATPQELVEALTSGEALTYQAQTNQAQINQAQTNQAWTGALTNQTLADLPAWRLPSDGMWTGGPGAGSP